MFFGKGDDLLKKPEIRHSGGRIVRKIDDQDLWSREGLAIDPLQIVEEVTVRTQLDSTDFSPRNNETVHMNGIGRRRRQHDITGPDQSERQMRQPFFGTDRDDGL